MLAATLGGCAMNTDTLNANLMSDPLKYEFYDCRQMEVQMKSLVVNEQKLHDLIVRAEQGTGGGVIATLAYKNDYLKVRADIQLLRQAQVRRNCIRQTEQGGIGVVH